MTCSPTRDTWVYLHVDEEKGISERRGQAERWAVSEGAC
jgi:hypothetical protein